MLESCVLRMDGSGLELCPVAVFGISDESLGSASRDLGKN
jgi:hypothetical protein